MSEVKVNKISPRSGTTLTLGDSGDDFVIPAGATLTNNGTASGFASIAWQSTIVTGTTLAAVAGNGYWIDTTSNACTVTLPASASVGDQLIFVDYARTWGTNNVTLNLNSLNFQGFSSNNPVYDTNGQTINIVYSGATKGWIPISDDDVAYKEAYAIDFLVVAGGGGGGGYDHGAGGGAGGFRTSTQYVPLGTVITATVGDGGSGGTTKGTSGSNSSISGTGLTTITSAGGGGGGANDSIPNINGSDGGSGGGGAGIGGTGSGTGGSGNTPSVSPSQGNNGGNGNYVAPYYPSAGGGGAGAVGSNAGTNDAGAGGNGTASSITGSSVTYAGGGGGATYSPASSGAGGTGGGGAGGPGGPSLTAGTAGTANTGGGGGGASGLSVSPFSKGTSGAGGSGVVILRMLTSDYTGTVTGSPTVTTDGSYTVVKFTATGSYTA